MVYHQSQASEFRLAHSIYGVEEPAWQLPEAVADQLLAETAPGDYPVLEENWPVVQLFLAVKTQWRVAPMGGVLGLDYAAVDVAIRRGAPWRC